MAPSSTGPQGARGLTSCFRGRPLRATRRKGWGLRGGGAGREGGWPHRDGGLAGIPAEPEQQGTGHLLLGHNLEVRTAREGSAPIPPRHADPALSLSGQPSSSKSTPQGPTPSLESLGHPTSLCVATAPHPGPGPRVRRGDRLSEEAPPGATAPHAGPGTPTQPQLPSSSGRLCGVPPVPAPRAARGFKQHPRPAGGRGGSWAPHWTPGCGGGKGSGARVRPDSPPPCEASPWAPPAPAHLGHPLPFTWPSFGYKPLTGES